MCSHYSYVCLWMMEVNQSQKSHHNKKLKTESKVKIHMKESLKWKTKSSHNVIKIVLYYQTSHNVRLFA